GVPLPRTAALGPGRHPRVGPHRRRLARPARSPGLEPVDPLRLRRLLLASLGLERDRLRGAGLSPGLQGPRARPPGELGTPGGRRPRSGSLGAAGRTGHATMIGRDGVRARNESAWLLPD